MMIYCCDEKEQGRIKWNNLSTWILFRLLHKTFKLDFPISLEFAKIKYISIINVRNSLTKKIIDNSLRELKDKIK